MNEKHERRLRRTAIRLKLQGLGTRAVGRRLNRSGSWVSKWWRRFDPENRTSLHSRSRRPAHSPQRYANRVRRTIQRVRRRLEQRRVGRLVGARAIERVIRQERLLPRRQRPAQPTIKRILREKRRGRSPRVSVKPYYPALTLPPPYVLHSMDWTARYLEGGPKVYAFHSLDVATRALHQTLGDNKRADTARAHALKTWQSLGLPDLCQIDNDAVWRGSLKTARHISQFMHLALYLGVELLFIPEGEPKRNGLIERLNGLWSQTFWKAQRFQSFAHVQRSSPAFTQWYNTQYEPLPQQPATPSQLRQRVVRRRLSAREIAQIPERLPLTAGRLHFIRRVDSLGDITLLHETWHVHKRLADQYVWATIYTQPRRLQIYYRRSAHEPVRLLKSIRYDFPEPVIALRTEFKRSYHRRKVCTML